MNRMTASVVTSVLFLAAGVAQGQISVTYPPLGSHVHTAYNGSTRSTLTPDPVTNANEFFLLPGVSNDVQNEISSGDWDSGEWHFDYTSKWRNTAHGNLSVDKYNATAPFKAFGGAELQARYTKAAGDADMNLQWIQLVKPVGFSFDPDETFNANTGASTGNGPIAAANGMFIDPYPNDGTDGGPFYWNETEWPRFQNGSDNFGAFSLKFSDRPRVAVQLGETKSMLFELYLVNWDGNANGTVEFLDGIQWGFTVTPTPGTLALFGMGSLLAVKRRRGTNA